MENLVGRICISRAGNDKGVVYIIVDDGEVATTGRLKIADGVKRTLEKPAVKNVRHLGITKKRAGDISSDLKMAGEIKKFERDGFNSI